MSHQTRTIRFFSSSLGLILALCFVGCTADGVDTVGEPDATHQDLEVVAVGPETQVTTNPADQFDPAISGSLLVYADRRDSSADVWVHDVVTDVDVVVSGVLGGDQLLSDLIG